MCGLTGFITRDVRSGEELRSDVAHMTETLTHRGPDDSGIRVIPELGLALGFRRLSIIDLSPAGHQPMRSSTGRFTLLFNGEVYNHPELRAQLETRDRAFRGHSDTEVILAAIEEWGIRAALPRFVGMFALALWDAKRRTITLARDRFGIKPLFIYQEPGYVSFASELKALVAGPHFDDTIDRQGLTAYLRYLYVPAPLTIYRRARKLRPGHLATIDVSSRRVVSREPYWSPREVAAQGRRRGFSGTAEKALNGLDQRLKEAVRVRLQADVPVGALLSGGVDSSLVVATMQEISSDPVRTFTIGFDVEEHDEAAFARQVADHLGTEHTELRVTGDDALSVIPRLPEMFDEPHADPSQIPTYLVSELARRSVTVALSGDGGDELFAGYNRYLYGTRVIRRADRIPRPLRHALSSGLASIPPGAWNGLHATLETVHPGTTRMRLLGEKMQKLARLLAEDDPASMYGSLLSAWATPSKVVVDGSERPDAIDEVFGLAEPFDLLDRMMLADQMEYLPDDLLAKVDRASMAVSLEVRVPLLDHRIAELAWRLPNEFRLRKARGKWLLRQLLYRKVPRRLVDRPKVGFTVPVYAWLRGPLREWAEELLAPNRLRSEGFLREKPIRQAWNALLGGRSDLALEIWTILMFQAWRDRWTASGTLASTPERGGGSELGQATA